MIGYGMRERAIPMNMHFNLAAGLLLCLSAAQSMAADASAARRSLTADDFYRVLDVSDPQVSPDGLWVAYVLGTNDRDSDEARSAIWMVSWDGTQRLALTAAADGTSKPRWSPDGRYLSFLSTPAGSDKSQIMLLDRRGGDAGQLTNVTGDIGEYAWSPDGKRLVFTMEPNEAGTAAKPLVIDALHFKQDAEGYLHSGRERHLYLFDIDGKHLEQLTSDPQFNEDLPVWSPDGRRIAFIRTHEIGADPDGREDFDVIDAQAGASPAQRRASLCTEQPEACLESRRLTDCVLAGHRTQVQRLYAGPSRRRACRGRGLAPADRQPRSGGDVICLRGRLALHPISPWRTIARLTLRGSISSSGAITRRPPRVPSSCRR